MIWTRTRGQTCDEVFRLPSALTAARTVYREQHLCWHLAHHRYKKWTSSGYYEPTFWLAVICVSILYYKISCCTYIENSGVHSWVVSTWICTHLQPSIIVAWIARRPFAEIATITEARLTFTKPANSRDEDESMMCFWMTTAYEAMTKSHALAASCHAPYYLYFVCTVYLFSSRQNEGVWGQCGRLPLMGNANNWWVQRCITHDGCVQWMWYEQQDGYAVRNLSTISQSLPGDLWSLRRDLPGTREVTTAQNISYVNIHDFLWVSFDLKTFSRDTEQSWSTCSTQDW